MSEFRQAAQDLKRFQAKLKRQLEAAEAKTAKEALKIAKKQSSGSVSTAQLIKEDHPFAKRHGSPKRDPSTINVQSGAFRAEWHIQNGNSLDDGPAVVNYSRVARFLQEGTASMFARPIEAVVIAKLQSIRPKNLDQAVAKAIQ